MATNNEDAPIGDPDEQPPRWFQWFGLNQPRMAQRGPIHPVFIPQAPAEQIEQAVAATRAAKDLAAELRPFDVESAVSFLNIRMYAQRITERYRAQCATLLTQEMDRQGLRDLTRREAIIREGVEIHIVTKLRTEPRWTYEGVKSINKFNNAIESNVERRHPYFYWKTESAQLTTPLNTYGPWQDESSFRMSHILAPLALTAGAAMGLAMVGYATYRAVKYFTSPHSCALPTCSTTQKIAEPLTQLIASGTARIIPQTTNPQEFLLAIDTSSSSDVILKNLQQTNTSVKLTQAVEKYIEQQQTGWLWAIRSWIGHSVYKNRESESNEIQGSTHDSRKRRYF